MSGPQEKGRGCKVKQKTGFPEAMGECSPSDEKKEVATASHPASQPVKHVVQIDTRGQRSQSDGERAQDRWTLRRNVKRGLRHLALHRSTRDRQGGQRWFELPKVNKALDSLNILQLILNYLLIYIFCQASTTRFVYP